MTAALANNPPDDPPSPTLLLALANELASLSRTGAMLQELVSGKVRAGSLSGMALLDAQDADLLVQNLGELAKFLRLYAEGLQGRTPNALDAALDQLVLSALAGRLAPNRTTSSAVTENAVEFF